jgi:hypothetical protein
MHQHLATAIPTPYHKGLMRSRLSCSDLRIHDHTRDRPQRICTFCGTNRSWPHGRLEDELYLVLECPIYDEIIKWYPALFNPLYANINDFMSQSYQYSVAFLSVPACLPTVLQCPCDQIVGGRYTFPYVSYTRRSRILVTISRVSDRLS